MFVSILGDSISTYSGLTHPTALGHQMIAEEWIACLSKLL